MSSESYDYSGGRRSHPARIGVGIAVGAGIGGAVGAATGNFDLWLPAFLGGGVALGVVFAVRE